MNVYYVMVTVHVRIPVLIHGEVTNVHVMDYQEHEFKIINIHAKILENVQIIMADAHIYALQQWDGFFVYVQMDLY